MKNKKIVIIIIAIVVIICIAVGIFVAIEMNQENKNRAIFEKEIATILNYNIALYDGDAKFEYEIHYDKDEICIVFIVQDEYTRKNYSDGGIRVNKEENTVETYGIYELEDIENILIEEVEKNYYIEAFLQ